MPAAGFVPTFTQTGAFVDASDALMVADKYRPRLRKTLVVGFATVGDLLPWPEIRKAAFAGDLGRVLSLASTAWDDFIPQFERTVSNSLLPIVGEAGSTAAAQFGGVFDMTNPRAVAWARDKGSDLVRQITATQKDAIRALVARSQLGEMTTMQVARSLRGVVGLDERRVKALTAYAKRVRALLSMPGGVRKTVEAKTDAAVERYARRLLRSRTETIARTESMFAAHAGQLEAWQQAVEQGKLSKLSEKRWLVTKDDRLCPKCRPLQNLRAPINGVFPGTTVTHPPLHPNCRCTMGVVPKRVGSLYSGAKPGGASFRPPLPPLPPLTTPAAAKLAALTGNTLAGGAYKVIPAAEFGLNTVPGWAVNDAVQANASLASALGHPIDASAHFIDHLKELEHITGVAPTQQTLTLADFAGMTMSGSTAKFRVPLDNVDEWVKDALKKKVNALRYNGKTYIVRRTLLDDDVDAFVAAWANGGGALEATVYDFDAILAWQPKAALTAENIASGAAKLDDIVVKQLAGAGGTNPGGLFEAVDGSKWYVKFYSTPQQGWGEAVANNIYRELGLSAPETVVGTLADGRHVFATRWLDDVAGTGETFGVDAAAANKFMDGFAADVLTANWDAVGAGVEHPLGNIVIFKSGGVARIDQGGTFLYRGLTGPKPTSVLQQITEWDKFLDGVTNPLYAKVAKTAGITKAEQLGARAIKQIDDIVALSERPGGWAAFVDEALKSVPNSASKTADAEAIVKMLEARTAKLAAKRADLAAKIPGKAATPPIPAAIPGVPKPPGTQPLASWLAGQTAPSTPTAVLPPINPTTADALASMGLKTTQGKGVPVAPFTSAGGPAPALIKQAASFPSAVLDDIDFNDVRVHGYFRRVNQKNVVDALVSGDADVTLYRFGGKLYAAGGEDVARVSALRIRAQANLGPLKLRARVVDLDAMPGQPVVATTKKAAAAPSGAAGSSDTRALWARAVDDAHANPGTAQTVVFDGGDVEDMVVQVRVVVDQTTKDVLTEVKFKLTDDSAAKKLMWKENKKLFVPNQTTPQYAAFEGIPHPLPAQFGQHTAIDFTTDQWSFYRSRHSGGRFVGDTHILRERDGSLVYWHQAKNLSDNTTAFSYHNTVQAYFKGKASGEQIDDLLTTLGVRVSLPSAADTLALAENRVLRLMTSKRPSAMTLAERKQFLAAAKSQWGIDPRDATWGRDGEGYATLLWPDAVAKKIAQRSQIDGFSHSIGCPDANLWTCVLSSDGLKPTTVRFSEGVPIGGQSSARDVATGGADYVFASPRQSSYADVTLRPSVLRRMDWHAHQGDRYGATNAAQSTYSAAVKNQKSLDNLGTHGGEVMFKRRVSWHDVDAVYMSRATRDEVIKRLRAKGISTVGGRPIDVLIKVK